MSEEKKNTGVASLVARRTRMGGISRGAARFLFICFLKLRAVGGVEMTQGQLGCFFFAGL